MAGGHSFPWLVTVLCQWAVFSWPARLLRYADLLYLWLCAHSLLAQGIRGLLPVLRPPACSGSAGSGGFSSHLWFTPFAMGSPLRGRGLFVLNRNEGLVCFPFPFGLFLPVVTTLRDAVTLWVRCWFGAPAAGRGCCALFSLWLGFEPLSEASLHALSYMWVSWWSSLRPRVFGCP